MNRVFATIVSVLLFGFPNNLFACKEVNWDEPEWAKNSSSIYVVRIVGISAPEMSKLPYTTDSVRDLLAMSRMDKEVSLIVYETLKGKSQEKSTVLLNWCGGGEVKLGYVGVLYGFAKEWHVKLGSNAITATKKALTNVSN